MAPIDNKVHLEFEDGQSADLQMSSTVTVLDAALERGLNLAHQCRSGSCTSCLGTLIEGETATVEGRGSSLLPSEYATGGRLLCSTYALSDASFRLPYPSALVYGPQPQHCVATIRAVRTLSATAVELKLELAKSDALDFHAGQYVRLRVPGTSEWRSYSMSTTPADLPTLTLLIKLMPDGVMTDYLRAEPALGSAMEVEGPFGTFLLDESATSYVLIAGGTGLAPVLSMLDTTRARRGPKPPVTLCFACETESDLFYEDELELRSFWMPTLDLRVAVTSPAPGFTGVIGNPVSLLRPSDHRGGAEAYVCGPPGMIEAAHRRLTEFGFPANRIHAERFVASEL